MNIDPIKSWKNIIQKLTNIIVLHFYDQLLPNIHKCNYVPSNVLFMIPIVIIVDEV